MPRLKSSKKVLVSCIPRSRRPCSGDGHLALGEHQALTVNRRQGPLGAYENADEEHEGSVEDVEDGSDDGDPIRPAKRKIYR